MTISTKLLTNRKKIKVTNNNSLVEGLNQNDLARLVKPRVNIDEFKSKMGEDADIAVLSFGVVGKQPAEDLVDFFEKGYDWVLDSDSSPGEFVRDIYLVFVEIERTEELPAQLQTLLEDLVNLTEIEVGQWRLYYGSDKNLRPVALETLAESIPLNPREYRQYQRDIERLKANSGLNIDTPPVRDEALKGLQSAAGIK
jgi:hypothetical protein